MKLQAKVDDSYHLIPIESSQLRKVSDVGLILDVSIDTERQRSTIQLAKYWATLNEIADNMTEQAYRLLLDNVAQCGQISPDFLHSSLKAMHGIESINLTKSTTETRSFFDFAFPMLERMKAAFYGH